MIVISVLQKVCSDVFEDLRVAYVTFIVPTDVLDIVAMEGDNILARIPAFIG